MINFAFDDPDPSKRLDALEAFIEHWMGPRLPEYGATPEQLDHLQLPTPLHRLYAFCYNWPREGALRGGIPLLSVQNYMMLLESTSEPQKGVPPGLLCFANENQGVTRWSTLFEGDDPPVYGLDYEEDTFYESPDGEVYESWRKLTPTLTDFLIGYVLFELSIATSNTIWTLTPIIELFESQPDLLAPLTTNVHGYPREIFLFDEDVLVTRVAQWKKPPKWELAVRDEAAVAKLRRFEGTVAGAGFSLLEDAPAGETERKWHVYFERDGSGTVSSSRSPRYLSRDSFPVGAVSIESIVAEIEANAQSEQSEDYQFPVSVRKEVVRPVSQEPTQYLSASSIGALFRQAIDAIDDPSVALLEQLELGSPLDW